MRKDTFMIGVGAAVMQIVIACCKGESATDVAIRVFVCVPLAMVILAVIRRLRRA